MPDWWIAVAQMTLATGLTVFGIVLLLTAGRTRLTLLLSGAAVLAGWAVFVHFFHHKVPGWPAFLTGVFVWINAYSVFKHRLALAKSISRAQAARTYGRRYND